MKKVKTILEPVDSYLILPQKRAATLFVKTAVYKIMMAEPKTHANMTVHYL